MKATLSPKSWWAEEEHLTFCIWITTTTPSSSKSCHHHKVVIVIEIVIEIVIFCQSSHIHHWPAGEGERVERGERYFLNQIRRFGSTANRSITNRDRGRAGSGIF